MALGCSASEQEPLEVVPRKDSVPKQYKRTEAERQLMDRLRARQKSVPKGLVRLDGDGAMSLSPALRLPVENVVETMFGSIAPVHNFDNMVSCSASRPELTSLRHICSKAVSE